MANKWTETDLNFLRENYNSMSYAKMSGELGRELSGLIAKCRRMGLVKDPQANGFKRGQVSSNKNLKQPGDIIIISRKGKGIPHVKLQNGEWVSLARKNWSDANGTIAKGYCIVHNDLNTLNCELDNLKLIKRGTFNRKPEKIKPTKASKNSKSKIWSIDEIEAELQTNTALLNNKDDIFKIRYDTDTVSEMKASKVLGNIEKYKIKLQSQKNVEAGMFGEVNNVQEYLNKVAPNKKIND